MPGRAYSDGYSDGYGPQDIGLLITDTIVLPLPINCVLAGDQPLIEKRESFADRRPMNTRTRVNRSASNLVSFGEPPSFTTTTKGLR